MNTANLDTFMAFNDQLLALIEAGVPFDVGHEIPDGDLSAMLTRINSAVARRVSRGDSIEAAIEAEEAVPNWYRNLIVSGLQSDNLDAALRDFSRFADSAEESREVADSALFYPLVVCCLAYLGMIGCSLFFAPRLESAYASFEIQPGTGLAILQTLRDALPFWIGIPPVLLFIFVWWQRRNRNRSTLMTHGGSGLLSTLSGTSGAMHQQRRAHFADSMASLDESQVPLKQALALSAGACGDRSLTEAANYLSQAISDGSLPDSESADANQFPPFMRWALLRSEPSVKRSRALRMAAALYRNDANHKMRRAKIIAPILGLVFIGGTVTLLYSLTLFMPVVQMLKAVAAPR